MTPERSEPSLLVIESLMLSLIEKGVLQTDDVVEMLEAASAALSEEASASAADVERIAHSVRRAACAPSRPASAMQAAR
jgi:hypothetical protein